MATFLERVSAMWHSTLIRVGDEAFTIGQIVLVVLLLIVGYVVSKIIERLIERRMNKADARVTAVYAVKRIAFYTVIVIVVITVLSLLNVPLTAFAFVSGAVAIGVGFGAQNIINNFISGWILLTEQPVRIGDFIEIDDHMGVVEYIGNRSTRIRRVDGVHLLIPNSQMLERVVVNWTLVDKQIRTVVHVGVAYGSPLRAVEQHILTALNEHEAVNRNPEPSVALEDFGDNAIVFRAQVWCDVGGERELRKIRSDIRFRIAELFDQDNIVIAFPQRDVHLDTSSPLQFEMVGKDNRSRDTEPSN